MNNLSSLFNEVALYESKEFCVLQANESEKDVTVIEKEIDNFYAYIGFTSERLITDCIFCAKEFPFTYKVENYSLNSEFNGSVKLGEIVTPYWPGKASDYETLVQPVDDGKIRAKATNKIYLSLSNYSMPKPLKFPVDLLNKKQSMHFIDYYFRCANVSWHQYAMKICVIYDKGNIKVTKIGQYPSSTLIGGHESKKYKSILEKFDAYDDYRNSERAFSHGLSVGAYDYFRRVYEKMINKYLCDSGHKNLMSSKTTSADKIDAVRDFFHPDIRMYLKPLYVALSIGVHTISDSECSKYYDEIKTVIDLQLAYEMEQQEMNKAVKKPKMDFKNLIINMVENRRFAFIRFVFSNHGYPNAI